MVVNFWGFPNWMWVRGLQIFKPAIDHASRWNIL